MYEWNIFLPEASPARAFKSQRCILLAYSTEEWLLSLILDERGTGLIIHIFRAETVSVPKLEDKKVLTREQEWKRRRKSQYDITT